MSGDKCVCFRFIGFGKTGKPAGLPQFGKQGHPAAEQLVDITLMADIVQDTVMKWVINIKKRNAEFNDTQIGSQVPAGLGYDGNQLLPDLQTELIQFIAVQRLHICCAVDFFQDSQWFSSFYRRAASFPIVLRTMRFSYHNRFFMQ